MCPEADAALPIPRALRTSSGRGVIRMRISVITQRYASSLTSAADASQTRIAASVASPCSQTICNRCRSNSSRCLRLASSIAKQLRTGQAALSPLRLAQLSPDERFAGKRAAGPRRVHGVLLREHRIASGDRLAVAPQVAKRVCQAVAEEPGEGRIGRIRHQQLRLLQAVAGLLQTAGSLRDVGGDLQHAGNHALAADLARDLQRSHDLLLGERELTGVEKGTRVVGVEPAAKLEVGVLAHRQFDQLQLLQCFDAR